MRPANKMETGDPTADRIYHFIVAHCQRFPEALADDYCKGHLQIYFSWQYLSYQTGTPRHDVTAAVGYLASTGFIRFDKFLEQGLHLWLTKPVDRAA